MKQNFRLLYIAIFLFICSSLCAQYTVFPKGDKFGVKEGDKIILKAKYTTILPGDSGIFALEKKGKWEYMSLPDKRSVYSASDCRFLPFNNGFGLVHNPKNYSWYSVDTNGTASYPYYEQAAPLVYGRYVLFAGSKKLYNHKAGLLCAYDSLIDTENFLHIRSTEKVAGSKKVLGIRISSSEVVSRDFLLAKKTGTLFDGIRKIEQLPSGNLFLHRADEGNNMLISAEGKILLQDISACVHALGDLYVITTASDEDGIWNADEQKWLVVPQQLKSVDTLGKYAWIAAVDEKHSIVTDGRKVIGEVDGKYRKRLNEKYLVVETSAGLSLYSPDGKAAKGESYDAILGPEQDGKMIVQRGQRFAYIDIESGKVIGDYHPLYYAVGSSTINDRARRFMTFFVAVFATPALPLVEKSLGKSQYKSYIYTVNPPAPYKNGYAILGVADKTMIKAQGDSLFLEGGNFSIDYVYMDESGKTVSPTYDEAMDFNNGWAWVKDGRGFFRVNTSFQPLEKSRYASIEEVWNGDYYIVEKSPFHKGLMDKNGNWAAPAKYDWFTVEDKQITGVSGGDGTVIITK